MKKSFILYGFLIFTGTLHAQHISLDNLLNAASLPAAKFDAYFSKKGFANAGKSLSDNSATLYKYNPSANKKTKVKDSTIKSFTRQETADFVSINYFTSSEKEYNDLRTQMIESGFYSNEEEDSSNIPSLLFQHNNVTVVTGTYLQDSTTFYSLTIKIKNFPPPKEILFADDLLTFTSHEYLCYYFGAANVKRDTYFLGANKTMECSVLFANTSRQVVFIWKDQTNYNCIVNLLLGGQQQLKSSMNNESFVGESTWFCKSGLRAGMSLYELRKLNANNFKFYGGRSRNSGAVIPETNGKLDFKKEDIILGCINCNDSQFSKASEINADDALAEGRIVFVLSVCLNAPAITKLN